MTAGVASTEEETIVISLMARVLYLQYCEVKGFTPTPVPYVPAWALDYARVAVDMLAWDDEGIERMREAVK